MSRINQLVDIHRQKKYKIEQLKNSLHQELGITFNPITNDNSRFNLSSTFEERNLQSSYPNRKTVLNRLNNNATSGQSLNNSISINNISYVQNDLVNKSNRAIISSNKNSHINIISKNNLNNKENSFSSKLSFNNNQANNIADSQRNLNDFKSNANYNNNNINDNNNSLNNTHNTLLINSNRNKANNINKNLSGNKIRNTSKNNNNNTNSFISLNKTKSAIKSTHCNFSTAKNTPDYNNSKHPIDHVSSSKTEQIENNPRQNNFLPIDDANYNNNNNNLNNNSTINSNIFIFSNVNEYTTNSHLNNSKFSDKNSNANKNIFNKKAGPKIQETRNIVKRIDSKGKVINNSNFNTTKGKADSNITERLTYNCINNQILKNEKNEKESEEFRSHSRNTRANNLNFNSCKPLIENKQNSLTRSKEDTKEANNINYNSSNLSNIPNSYSNSNLQVNVNRNKNYGELIYASRSEKVDVMTYNSSQPPIYANNENNFNYYDNKFINQVSSLSNELNIDENSTDIFNK